MKIMAYGPIISWQIDGETMETVTDFIFLGSKITSVVTAAMKLKDTCFLKKSYDQPAAAAAAAAKSLQSCPTLCDPHRRQPTRLPLSSILKSRDITLPTKVHLTKDMVFPVVMYGCESWTIKKAEC